LPDFKNLATAFVQNGRSCFLWLDTWNQTLWSQACPHLFSFAKSHFVSLHTAVTSEHLEDLFHLPLSAEAFTQFQTLQTALQTLHLSDSHDSWTYSWGNAGFSSRKVYKHLVGHHDIHSSYKWLWMSSCQNKRKLFFWLILSDRLSTRVLLRRRQMVLDDYTCVMCTTNVDEDLLHMLFHCPFAAACWYSLQCIVPATDDLETILEALKVQIRRPFFMEIIVTMCWSIWMMRNDLIFRNVAHSVQRCKVVFRQEFALVVLRAKASYQPGIDQWIELYV
jgi:hypothetical protein